MFRRSIAILSISPCWIAWSRAATILSFRLRKFGPTFYYHFQDKYDLMAWIFCQRTLQTDVLSVESAAAAMNGMRQDYVFFKRTWEDNSQSPMWAYMHEYFVKRYTEIAREKTGGESDAQTRFSIRLYCYGTLGMTREWLMKDNITPAQTVVEMMFRSMPERLRELYFAQS